MRLGRFLACYLVALVTCLCVAVSAPAATTQFDFNNGDLTPTFGPGSMWGMNDTDSVIQFGNATSFLVVPDESGFFYNAAAPMADGDPQVMCFPKFPGVADRNNILDWAGARGFFFNPATVPTPGYNRVNKFTLILDLLVPDMQIMGGGYMGVYDGEPDQLDPYNGTYRRGGDCEFFVRRVTEPPQPEGYTSGLGIDGNYPGSIAQNQWARIAVTIDLTLTETPTEQFPLGYAGEMRRYINGVEIIDPAGKEPKIIGHQGKGGPDDRFSLSSNGPGSGSSVYGFDYFPTLFYDRDSETGPGLLSSLYFTDRVMSAAEIAALGGPSVNGIFVPEPGDANADGVVDAADASILGANWRLATGATWGMGDFNGDHAVDDADAAILAANWTVSAESSVPEPGTLVLLASAVAALCLLRRR
jgi:hypothetical protein